MAQIFDTDVEKPSAEIEFWEKVKSRLETRRRLWVILTVTLVVGISAVPVWMDRSLKWKGQRILRLVAESVQAELTAAAVDKGARRFRWDEGGILTIARLTQCNDVQPLVESKISFDVTPLMVLGIGTAQHLQIPGVIDEFCYDPVLGPSYDPKRPWAFGVIPVNDVAEGRLDRISLLLFQGDTVQIEFDQLTD